MEQFLSPLMLQQAMEAQGLREANALTARYGLTLNEQDITALMEKRAAALTEAGRVEFGKGILEKLVYAFCDSPYLFQETYVDTLLTLQEAFYYFKNESLDTLTDDELIGFMKEHFDGDCEGSAEYLAGTLLEDLCREIRYEEEE